MWSNTHIKTHTPNHPHMHTSSHQTEPVDITAGLTKHKAVYLQNILLYYRKSSGFEYTSFKEVHSAWRFGVLRLETSGKGWRGWGAPTAWRRAADVPEGVHLHPSPKRDSVHNHRASRGFFVGFFCTFCFSYKSGWKKVALKIQSILLYFSFRQAKR